MTADCFDPFDWLVNHSRGDLTAHALCATKKFHIDGQPWLLTLAIILRYIKVVFSRLFFTRNLSIQPSLEHLLHA